MKNKLPGFWRWFRKAVIAGILSFLIVSAFSFFYYNPPVHVAAKDGITDYMREPGVFWSRGTEGFAAGSIDALGYSNVGQIDAPAQVVYMGSSHTEGLYVNPDESYPALLNDRFREAGIDLHGYNIGMSAHTFLRNVKNAAAAADKFSPKYLVIEVTADYFSAKDAQKALEGNMSKLKYYSPKSALYWIQKNPYVKLAYLQYKNYSAGEGAPSGAVPTPKPEYIEALDSVMARLEEIAAEKNLTVVIFYMPDVLATEDAGRITVENPVRDVYRDACQAHGIVFADSTDCFDRAYREEYIVPKGFPNTAVGYGHLNPAGHRLAADVLFDVLTACEKEAAK